ncbi:MAG: hypothetical protein RMK78_10565 [Thermaurantiacus sp.]|uniref:hypothetical protein n=1 Tax=Thermaurantiacus sp. TaxID=2820283 RepID=UPI00298F082F|nr:hypothetical protein [Thermaurantiacus sp.]MDW8415888.1 hypothetical protein [Thermaurantiacus sp.]
MTNAPSRARQFLEAGDIALSTVRPYLRRTVHLQNKDADVASTAFCVLRAKPDMVGRFLFHWVTSDQFVSRLLPLQRGSSPPAVLDVDVRAQPVPVPPRDLQAKIATRIDALFAEVAAGEEALAAAKAALGQWRQALLKAAVTGELTADWRAANPPAETGEALLARILAERRARWHADPRNKGKRYREPVSPDTTNLPTLPDGWTWASLYQLIDGIDAGQNLKCVERPPGFGEVGIVKVSAVTWWHFNPMASKTLPASAAVDRRALISVGDLLISRANTLELVGAPAIVTDLPHTLVLSDKVLRLNCLREFRTWLFFVLRSSIGRRQIESQSTGAQLSMRNISQDALKSIAIPIGPKREMTACLDLLNDTLATADKTVRDQRELAQKSSSLRQSILAAAFRGELAA